MSEIKVVDLREIAADQQAFVDKTVTVQGWVRNHRKQKNIGFIEFFDGTVLSPMQIVYDEKVERFADVQAIRNGAAIRATGKLVMSPKGQLEMQAQEVVLEGDCSEDYPLQPKRHSLEFLREIAYLRPRTRLFQAVFRVRSIAAQAIHNYFQARGYVYVHTPLITGNDAEGAGNTFTVTTAQMGAPYKPEEDFFGHATALAVTGQLEGETYAMAYKRIYTFGPTFRAENSNTRRHAAEFWMVEPEMAFADLEDDMEVSEAMLKYVIRYVMDRCPDELAMLNKFVDKGLVERLEHVAGSEFARVTYTDAVQILVDAQTSGEAEFEYPVSWGCDLQTEHERFLTEKHFGKPTFVTDYPAQIKAFYMRMNDDGKTVAAVDCLVPGIGEIIGGSQREERLELLEQRIRDLGMDPEQYKYYCDLRRYGSCRHAGFGLGFERLVMYLTGIDNIRDVIPHPRTVGNADF